MVNPKEVPYNPRISRDVVCRLEVVPRAAEAVMTREEERHSVSFEQRCVEEQLGS